MSEICEYLAKQFMTFEVTQMVSGRWSDDCRTADTSRTAAFEATRLALDLTADQAIEWFLVGETQARRQLRLDEPHSTKVKTVKRHLSRWLYEQGERNARKGKDGSDTN